MVWRLRAVWVMEMDLSSHDSILNLIAKTKEYGEISMLANAAGVSTSQVPIEAILKVVLYGTAFFGRSREGH